MKSITENLALLTIIAITVSVIQATAYYNVFGVNIAPYMDFSEVIQLYFRSILGTVGGMLITLTIMVIAVKQKDLGIIFFTPICETTPYRLQLLRYLVPVLGFALFCGSTYFTGSKEAQAVLDGHSLSEVTLISDSATIRTDSTLAYVGATKNYIVLFDRKAKQAKVLKSDKFSEIRYSEGVNRSK